MRRPLLSVVSFEQSSREPMTTYLLVGFLLFSLISLVTLAVAIKNAKEDSLDQWGFPQELPVRVRVRHDD